MWVIRGNSMTKYQTYYAVLSDEGVTWVSDKAKATQFEVKEDALAAMNGITSRKRMVVEGY